MTATLRQLTFAVQFRHPFNNNDGSQLRTYASSVRFLVGLLLIHFRHSDVLFLKFLHRFLALRATCPPFWDQKRFDCMLIGYRSSLKGRPPLY